MTIAEIKKTLDGIQEELDQADADLPKLLDELKSVTDRINGLKSDREILAVRKVEWMHRLNKMI